MRTKLIIQWFFFLMIFGPNDLQFISTQVGPFDKKDDCDTASLLIPQRYPSIYRIEIFPCWKG